MYFRVFWRYCFSNFYNVLFKGILLERILLALSGPDTIVCPLGMCVKDIHVDNWGKLF